MTAKCHSCAHKMNKKNSPSKKLGPFRGNLNDCSGGEKIDSGSLNLEAEKVVYSESLELWREFKWEVLEKTGADRAQSCMDLCLGTTFS